MNSYRNDRAELEQAIRSYIGQERVEMQLILVTVKGDEAVRVGEEMGVDDLVVMDKPGIYQQLNEGLKRIRGDWYCYASGNDVALPFKCYQEIECLVGSRETGVGSPQKEVCYSAFWRTDKNLQDRVKMNFHNYTYKQHLHGNFVNDCAMMSRRLIDKYGPFREEWENGAHWDMWLRIFEGEGDVFVYNNSGTWLYRTSEDSQHVRRANNKEWKARNRMKINMMLETHKFKV